MEARRSDQDRTSENVMVGPTLYAQQFYQHDPLLVLLKDKWHLLNLWIIAGVILFPGGAFLICPQRKKE